MDSTFVNAIAELTRIGCGPQSIVENGERFFSTVPLHMLPKLEEPTPLKVHTLTALADYVQENRDALSLDRCMIHVVSPLCVTIHSNLMERSQRFSYLMAVVESPLREVLDTWLTPLQAIISLQTLFVPEGDHATVLGLLGSLALGLLLGLADGELLGLALGLLLGLLDGDDDGDELGLLTS